MCIVQRKFFFVFCFVVSLQVKCILSINANFFFFFKTLVINYANACASKVVYCHTCEFNCEDLNDWGYEYCSAQSNYCYV